MNQMMLALLYANPDAFIGQNINRLKQGAILRIPGREEALNVAAAEAAAVVREQTEAWRQQFATIAQPAEPEPDTDREPRTAAAPRSSSDSRLELVPPRSDSATGTSAQSGASADATGRELRAELVRAREDVNTLNQENVELKSRVGELEKSQGDSQRLIDLQDSELAAAQKRLSELEARLAQADAAAGEVSPDAMPGQDEGLDGSVEEPDTLTLDEPDAEAAAPLEPATLEIDSEAAPESVDPVVQAPISEPVSTPVPIAEEPAASATPPPVRVPEPTPWYMNIWVLAGGGLVLVGLVALVLARRKSGGSSAAPRYSSSDVASSLAAAKGGGAAATSADDGVDEQEADLIEAVAIEPANLSAHLDLVRYYYDQGDAASFEQAAEAMYARVYDPEDMSWKQTVAMGQEMAPDHPLFVAARATEYAEPEAPSEPEPDDDLDWGSAGDNDSTQQMSLDELEAHMTGSAPEPAPAPPRQIETPVSTPVATASYNQNPSSASSGSGDNGDDEQMGEDTDAASTKLELARAYLDMGDVEGARGMLEEVVNEGNPGQRAEAKRLLDEIR
jgi:pilus assembly protein FimV